MDYKILILSDKVIAGQLDVDIYGILTKFARTNNHVKEIKMLPFDKAECKSFIEKEGDNLIIFCENSLIDPLIIDEINSLGMTRHTIDDLAVVFDDKNIIFLPIDLDYLNLLGKILEETKNKNLKYCTFRLFGKGVDEVVSQLNENKGDTLNFSVLGRGLLTDVYASYEGEDNLIDNQQVIIANLFKDNIYSENELGLGEIAFETLKLKGLKLALREGITGGNVTATLAEKTPQFKEVIASSEVTKIGDFTPERIYDEALNVLKSSICDVSLVTGGNFDDNGLNFVLAIGDKSSIHVYKSRFNANPSECLEMATKCALFHLVKKLRQNNFAF